MQGDWTSGSAQKKERVAGDKCAKTDWKFGAAQYQSFIL